MWRHGTILSVWNVSVATLDGGRHDPAADFQTLPGNLRPETRNVRRIDHGGRQIWGDGSRSGAGRAASDPHFTFMPSLAAPNAGGSDVLIEGRERCVL